MGSDGGVEMNCPRCERYRPRRIEWLIALWIAVGVLVACSPEKEDHRRDLRDYALNPDIPRQSRIDTLMAILRNRDEDPHLRATAAQMLGELRHEPAARYFAEILGGRQGIRPDASEWLRMEAIRGLGLFAKPEYYRLGLSLVYESRRDPSDVVRRQFVQGFANAPMGDRESAAVLLDFMRIVEDTPDDDSITFRALLELRRITSRPDLNAFEFDKWADQLREMEP